MIDYQLFCRIKDLKQNHGLTSSQIAKELSLDPRTVAGCLSRDRFLHRKPAKRASKLDGFKNDIIRSTYAPLCASLTSENHKFASHFNPPLSFWHT